MHTKYDLTITAIFSLITLLPLSVEAAPPTIDDLNQGAELRFSLCQKQEYKCLVKKAYDDKKDGIHDLNIFSGQLNNTLCHMTLLAAKDDTLLKPETVWTMTKKWKEPHRICSQDECNDFTETYAEFSARSEGKDYRIKLTCDDDEQTNFRGFLKILGATINDKTYDKKAKKERDQKEQEAQESRESASGI